MINNLSSVHLSVKQKTLPTISISNLSSATISGSDVAGIITFTTTSATDGTISVTYATPYINTPVVSLTPGVNWINLNTSVSPAISISSSDNTQFMAHLSYLNTNGITANMSYIVLGMED